MCDCIKRVNSHLAKFNTEIELPLWTSNGQITPFIQTMKVDDKKRGKPRLMFAIHCPFCGEKYQKSQEKQNENADSTRC